MELIIKDNIATLYWKDKIFSRRPATIINIRKMEAVRMIIKEYFKDEAYS